MNFGFNSNVPVGEAIYHVQTEDRGPSHPFLDTVVYLGGRVVYKRSTGYGQVIANVDAQSLPEKLHELLAQQHRAVISELESGTLTLNTKKGRGSSHGDRTKTAPNQHGHDSEDDFRQAFDLRLLNPKNWLSDGEVTFKIALSDKRTKEGIGGADVQACMEKKGQRTSCAEATTDQNGRAQLQFPLPQSASEGSTLVVRATDGVRFGELRFKLKASSRAKTPAPTLR